MKLDNYESNQDILNEIFKNNELKEEYLYIKSILYTFNSLTRLNINDSISEENLIKIIENLKIYLLKIDAEINSKSENLIIKGIKTNEIIIFPNPEIERCIESVKKVLKDLMLDHDYNIGKDQIKSSLSNMLLEAYIGFKD